MVNLVVFKCTFRKKVLKYFSAFKYTNPTSCLFCSVSYVSYMFFFSGKKLSHALHTKKSAELYKCICFIIQNSITTENTDLYATEPLYTVFSISPDNLLQSSSFYIGLYGAMMFQVCRNAEDNTARLTLLHSERPKLYGVLAVLSATGLNKLRQIIHI